MIFLKSSEHVELIKKAANICSDTLSLLSLFIEPGKTGLEIDKLAEDYIRSRNGVPSCKGYRGYPSSICISVDSGAVHNIPTNKPILPGQTVKLDLVVSFQGWNVDSAITVLVPPVKPEVQKLVETTYLALWKGIGQAIDGKKVLDISQAIFDARTSFGVVKEFCGHGCGKSIHEDPKISNIPNGDNTLLCAGMIICIEPIFTLGKPDVHVQEGDWNTWTLDNSIVAHWEHSVLVTKDKPEILTLREGEKNAFNI